MAYETGTTTGPQDLIQNKLAAFAAALGWSVQNCTTGLNFSIGSQYYGIYWTTNSVLLRAATGYSGAAAYNAQPGAAPSADCTININAVGPYLAYHFFGTNQYLHVAIESTSGVFSHFFIGQLQKAGAFTGGFYCTGTNWNYTTSYSNSPESAYHDYGFDRGNTQSANYSVLRADIDAKTNNWMRFNPTSSWNGNYARGGVRVSSMSDSGFDTGVINYNQLTPLWPIHLFVDRPSSFYSYAGVVQDLRIINMQNYAAGDQITIGSDNYLVFPCKQKTTVTGDGTTNPSSGNYGWAFRIVA